MIFYSLILSKTKDMRKYSSLLVSISNSITVFVTMIISLIANLSAYSQKSLTDCRDNQVYNVVNINGAPWMASNLNYESMRVAMSTSTS